MKVPKRLQPLVDDGLVDEILSQLMSGKEAQIYVVRCGAATRCAKVYKEANQRSFKQAVQYQEGRKVKNSRQARAMGKRTRYGQKESEQAWVNAEVDALYCLAAAGVRSTIFADNRMNSDGLITATFPAARAGASFQVAIIRG